MTERQKQDGFFRTNDLERTKGPHHRLLLLCDKGSRKSAAAPAYAKLYSVIRIMKDEVELRWDTVKVTEWFIKW